MTKRTMLLSGLLILLGITLQAGQLLSGQAVVPAGATNAVTEITLNDRAALDAVLLDGVFLTNSGGETGTVSYAVVNAGVAVAVESPGALAPGATSALWPRRLYPVGGVTNIEHYAAHRLRVTVVQTATNSAAAVYSFGATVR